MATPIDYPQSLPVPQTSVVSPAEMRQLSNERTPYEARALSNEQREFERVTFPAMNAVQAAVFQEWWKDDLIYGGAWFNAKWPLPRGFFEAQRKFVGAPRWQAVGRGYWKISALCEVRGRSLRVMSGPPPGGGAGIAWFAPINDRFSGSLNVTNAGSGDASDFSSSGVTTLYAGALSGTTVVWEIVSWTSLSGDASPILTDFSDGTASIQWVNWGGDEMPPPVYDPSIGTLILSATIDGIPVAVGDRLVVTTTPATIDYPGIAWGPE